MTNDEFSREFDIRFNYINSNLAYSVNAYEKSVYLTRAQEQLIDNYFDPSRNDSKSGYDESLKREIEFASIVKPLSFSADSNATVPPYNSNAKTFIIAESIFRVLDGAFEYQTSTGRAISTTVRPLDFASYGILRAKPGFSPPSGVSWRMMRGTYGVGNVIEVIYSPIFSASYPFKFSCRILKRPTPIVLENLPAGFSVDGVSVKTECSLPITIHDEILNRAIELCKIDYIGDTAGLIEINKRSE